MEDRYEQLVKGFKDGLANLKDLVEELPSEDAYDSGYEAAHAALAPIAWSKAVGDRIDTGKAQELLGITRQALAKRVTSGSLLGLPGRGTTYYPSWQFDSSRRAIRPEVRKILRFFSERGEGDPYMIATWMMAPNRDLDGAKPAEWLQDGREVNRLLQAARQVAERWSS
ncbi:hypothetical protein [Streptomyces bottropensis]|uniref:hypothetical protein n=1 Tax=Streptomyces bottropensis TaxID=42235 RepID=UPI00369D73B4